jgi:hypothetical protein
MTTNLTTIEHAIKHNCPACNKDTMHLMAYTEIDVDQRDGDGIPVIVGYTCCERGRQRVDKQQWETFTLRAEIRDTT